MTKIVFLPKPYSLGKISEKLPIPLSDVSPSNFYREMKIGLLRFPPNVKCIHAPLQYQPIRVTSEINLRENNMVAPMSEVRLQ